MRCGTPRAAPISTVAARQVLAPELGRSVGRLPTDRPSFRPSYLAPSPQNFRAACGGAGLSNSYKYTTTYESLHVTFVEEHSWGQGRGQGLLASAPRITAKF